MKLLLRVVGSPLFYIPVSGVLMFLSLRQIEFDQVGNSVSAQTVPWIGAAVLVNLSALPVWALRTKRLLGGLGHDVPIKDLTLLSSFANAANQLLPAGSGELGRGMFLVELHGVPGTTATAVLVFERLVGFGLMLVSSAFAAAFLLSGPLIALAILVVAAIGAVTFGLLGRSMVLKTSHGNDSLIRTTLNHIGRISSHPKAVAEFAVLSFIVYLVLAVGFILSSLAIGLSLDLLTAWALHGGGMVLGTLSAIPFGLGASEFAITTLGDALGSSAGLVALSALAMRLALTAPLGVVGALSYGALSRRLSLQS